MRCRELHFIWIINILLTGVAFAKDTFLLPEGPNRDLVIQNCLACHSEKIIIQNRMSRSAWDTKISWMQKTQNLWQIPKDARNKILDYLEQTQGLSSSHAVSDRMDHLGPRSMNPLP